LIAAFAVVILAGCALAGAVTVHERSTAAHARAQLDQQLAAKSSVDRLAVLAEQLQKNILIAQYIPGAASGIMPSVKAEQSEAAKIVQQESATDLPQVQIAAIKGVGTAISDYVSWALNVAKVSDPSTLAAATKQYNQLIAKQAVAVTAAQKLADSGAARQVKQVNQVMGRLVWLLIAICLTVAVLVPGLLFLFGRQLIARLALLGSALHRVAGGDLTVRVPAVGRDEVSAMAAHVNQVVERLAQVLTSIRHAALQLSGAATGLTDVAARVGHSAEEASTRAGVVADSADEVSQNVEAVSAGSHQMQASISEIAHNAHEAARVATDAVQAVEATTTTMNKLGDSSREIGEVVRLITSIAEQTNLLALNATIEAARAGDAGKGFAVVADEVKQLAQETARATGDISRRVETIQVDSDQATQAILDIAAVISRINEFQTTIAGAVEEQTGATQSINTGVSEAAHSSSQIAHNISAVASAAGETASSMTEARASAENLSRMSQELTQLIADFQL
jgi:methyl-accepting chemotaxis protein